jgi:tetratricopeptide (TPR) repeat protein
MKRASKLFASALALLAALAVTAPGPAARAEDGVAELLKSSFAHEAKGETAEALNDVLKILRQDKGHYFAALRAGWLYYLRGRYADSIELYERAEALAPKAIEPKLGTMLPLMAAARWAKAEVIGKEILAAAPGNYLARSRLAWIAFSRARYKDAEQLYRALLAHYPSDTDMQLGLAWTLVRQGRTAEARAAFEAILAISPDHVKAKAGLQAL